MREPGLASLLQPLPDQAGAVAHDPATPGSGRQLPDEPARSRRRAALEVVAVSLAVTAAAAVVASLAAPLLATRFSLAFVVLRWVIVGVFLVTPLLHQLALQRGSARRLPFALRTPATALVLTVESIVFDVLSARLG
jgi:hypothetical protein